METTLPLLRSPSIRLVDDGRELRLVALLAGIDRASLEVRVDGDLLSIAAERLQPSPPGDAVLRERNGGSFLRVLRLPYRVDGERAEVEYEDGFLHVRIPRAAEDVAPGRAHVPRCDLFEGPGELVLVADVPGVAPGDLVVRATADVVLLAGRVRPWPVPTGHVEIGELDIREYRRSVRLPAPIDPRRLHWTVADGVATVRMPRRGADDSPAPADS